MDSNKKPEDPLLPAIRPKGQQVVALIIILAILFWITTLLPIRCHQEPVSQMPTSIYKKMRMTQLDSARAAIRLPDGKIIYLDSIAAGTLAVVGNVTIIKAPDGQLVFQLPADQKDTIINTSVSNPAHAKPLAIKLTDGSQVWLNAKSSLVFPNAFNKERRSVQLRGEAYFETVQNDSALFEVGFPASVIGDFPGKIETPGARFNVSAEPDQGDITTTSIEGSLRVTAFYRGSRKMIGTGEQVLILADTSSYGEVRKGIGLRLISKPNLRRIVAWKEQ